MAPFHAMAELNQTAQQKNLNITNINTKGGPSNRQICLTLPNYFFNCQNNHHLGAAINFDYVSLPSTALEK